MLARYEYNPGAVNRNTKAVAITQPVQYAVAHLQTYLNRLSKSTLKDGNDDDVDVTQFPLTGLIVSGQQPVDFNFLPKTDGDQAYLVYDSQTQKSDGTYYTPSATVDHTGPVSTLLLQSADVTDPALDVVTVVAEFQNTGTTAFRGKNGTIRPGTKFYLVGTVPFTMPEASQTEDYRKRVFTKHYTTVLNISLTSLKNAYNVLPDILAPRLELGIQLTPQWQASTPTNVEME